MQWQGQSEIRQTRVEEGRQTRLEEDQERDFQGLRRRWDLADLILQISVVCVTCSISLFCFKTCLPCSIFLLRVGHSHHTMLPACLVHHFAASSRKLLCFFLCGSEDWASQQLINCSPFVSQTLQGYPGQQQVASGPKAMAALGLVCKGSHCSAACTQDGSRVLWVQAGRGALNSPCSVLSEGK